MSPQAACFVYYYYKSHTNTNTGVPINSSYPHLAPIRRSGDTFCLWFGIISLTSFPFCFGTAQIEILVTVILYPLSYFLSPLWPHLQSSSFLNPIQAYVTLFSSFSATTHSPTAFAFSSLLKFPTPLRLAYSISSLNTPRPFLSWAELPLQLLQVRAIWATMCSHSAPS